MANGLVIKVGDWNLAQAILQTVPKIMKDVIKTAVYQEAQFLAGEVKKKIRTGPFKGLSAWTLAGRRAGGFRGTKPLNVTGDMKAAVTVYPNQPAFECFVGVLKTAKRAAKIEAPGGKSFKGRSGGGGKTKSTATVSKPTAHLDSGRKTTTDTLMVNIAQVLEEGRTFMIKVTPRMKRFIMGVLVPELDSGGGGGGGLKKGVIVIHIPPRPFIRPVIEEFGPTVPQRFERRLLDIFAKKIGPKAKALIPEGKLPPPLPPPAKDTKKGEQPKPSKLDRKHGAKRSERAALRHEGGGAPRLKIGKDRK